MGERVPFFGPEGHVTLKNYIEAQVEHTELNGFSTKHIGRIVTINLFDKRTNEWKAFLTGRLLGWSTNDSRLTPYLEGGTPAEAWFDPKAFRAEVEVIG